MQKLKNIWAWLKQSRHSLHLFGEVVVTYIFSALLGLGLGLGIEVGQRFKGDWKNDFIADGIGIALGTLAQVLVIVFCGWDIWLCTIIGFAMLLMLGVTNIIASVRPYTRYIQVCGLLLGIIAFVGLAFVG